MQEDDATSITDVAGSIGVLFSNQQADAFYWTSRSDSAPLDQWDEP